MLWFFLVVEHCEKIHQFSTKLEHGKSEEADVRKNALPFVEPRYTRIFDVISGVNCV